MHHSEFALGRCRRKSQVNRRAIALIYGRRLTRSTGAEPHLKQRCRKKTLHGSAPDNLRDDFVVPAVAVRHDDENRLPLQRCAAWALYPGLSPEWAMISPAFVCSIAYPFTLWNRVHSHHQNLRADRDVLFVAPGSEDAPSTPPCRQPGCSPGRASGSRLTVKGQVLKRLGRTLKPMGGLKLKPAPFAALRSLSSKGRKLVNSARAAVP